MMKRLYLIPFDTAKLPSLTTDILVIGTGVAGLRAAIEAGNYLPDHSVVRAGGAVTILAKAALQETNTYYAQGGIASHINSPRLINSHIKDTLEAGHNLSEPEVVRYIIRNGVRLVSQLADWGMHFDRKGSKLDLAQEGGHSLPRILHAGGDATGKGLWQTLINNVRRNTRIRIMEDVFAIDILTAPSVGTVPSGRPSEALSPHSGRTCGTTSARTNIRSDGCYGALVYSNRSNQLRVIRAKKVILATGGIGQLFRETTNSDIATGDGIAMAYRAGCVLQDMEFVQFHPTAFYVAGASRALISEAVRGEGALLRDRFGCRFMPDYHPKAELAPRDIVARSIINQMKLTQDTNVYLDLTHFPPKKIKARFPGLAELCRRFAIDISKDLIPVRPSAHYMIGGIKTDIRGQTNIRNLFAAGECACCGFHGANRLGSNSLLEGLVMGYTAGKAAAMESALQKLNSPVIKYQPDCRQLSDNINLVDVRNALKSLMWHNAGLERNGQGLEQALKRIEYWAGYVMVDCFSSPAGWELQNMLTLAQIITKSALNRTESRGAHYRSDFPATNKTFSKHIVVSLHH
jgi:L-aspartate oxidase